MSYSTRRRLFAADPHCHWRRRETFLGPGKTPAGFTKHQRATIDHIKCKAETSSRAEYTSPANKVLACYLCNQQRNDAFLARRPVPKCTWKTPKRPLTPAELAGIERSRARRRAKRGPLVAPLVAETPVPAWNY